MKKYNGTWIDMKLCSFLQKSSTIMINLIVDGSKVILKWEPGEEIECAKIFKQLETAVKAIHKSK